MGAWISNTVFPSFISASDLFFWHTEHIHNPTKQSNMKCIYRQKKCHMQSDNYMIEVLQTGKCGQIHLMHIIYLFICSMYVTGGTDCGSLTATCFLGNTPLKRTGSSGFPVIYSLLSCWSFAQENNSFPLKYTPTFTSIPSQNTYQKMT